MALVKERQAKKLTDTTRSLHQHQLMVRMRKDSLALSVATQEVAVDSNGCWNE